MARPALGANAPRAGSRSQAGLLFLVPGRHRYASSDTTASRRKRSGLRLRLAALPEKASRRSSGGRHTAMHTCYGQQIVRAQLPAMAQGLFEGPRLRRARVRRPAALRRSRSHGLTIGFDDRR